MLLQRITRCAAMAGLASTLALMMGRQAMALPAASPPSARYACVAHAKGWFEDNMPAVFSLQVTSPSRARVDTKKGTTSEVRLGIGDWSERSAMFDRGARVTLVVDGDSQPLLVGVYGERGTSRSWLLKMPAKDGDLFVRCGDRPVSATDQVGNVDAQPPKRRRVVDRPTPPVRLPPGASLGGDFEPGHYRCKITLSDGTDGRADTYDFYRNGEWRMTNERDTKDGTYEFNPATGRFSAGYGTFLTHEEDDSNRTYTVHYRTSDGVMHLYGQQVSGLTRDYVMTNKCVRTGSADGEPPTVVKKREADRTATRRAREAEGERQVHAAPGRGMRPGDFKTILFTWGRDGQGKYMETIYLLLADGTAYKDMALPPEDFNLEAAKRLQPERWVAWRFRGGKYQVFDPDDKEWASLEGWPAIQARDGERLGREFSRSSFTGSLATGGTYSVSGITFKSDGRFERFDSSRTNTDNGVTTVHRSTHGDGKGSSSSTGSATESGPYGGDAPGTHGPSVVTTGSARRNDGASRRGTYQIKGWTLELRRDDGSVERRLFLFPSDKRDSVNIAGEGYSARKN